MCRFVLYHGRPISISELVIEPSNSIINQSLKSMEGDDPVNGDGFGIAVYVPDADPSPAVFKSVTPAWSDPNLLQIGRVLKSGVILAHVRAATPGLPITELNCHPFVYGPYAFMHNGQIAHFRKVRRRLLASLSDAAFDSIQGSTDSEHAFGIFGYRLAREQSSEPAARLLAALARTAQRIVALSAEATLNPDPNHEDNVCDLNFAASDGHCSVACRFTTSTIREAASLYVHTGQRYVCDGGVCRMVDAKAGQGAVIVASEPLSTDHGWRSIPNGHAVVIRPDAGVQVVPLPGAVVGGSSGLRAAA